MENTNNSVRPLKIYPLSIMPINLVVKPAAEKTKKRYTAIFRLHKGGKVIKITHFGQRNPSCVLPCSSF